MPYAMPMASPPSPENVHLDLPPLKLRPKHRRARSSTTASAVSFSDERGPGAFTSLPNLPRRHSQSSQAAMPTAAPGEKKTLFHFENEDSDSSDEQQHPPPPPYGSSTSRHSPPPQHMNALGLTVDTKNLPPNAPPRIEEPPVDDKLLQTSSLPFPSRGSPLPSPSPPSPTRSASTAASNASSLPRTPSTPIILSNGKPLKPSLKSSQTSPHLLSGIRLHSRAQSEPSTPSGNEGSPIVKNVHFPEKERIQSVRVFNASGRPVNVNSGGGTSSAGEETETETEYDSSSGQPSFMRVPGAPNAFPFPTMSSSSLPPSLSSTPSTYTISPSHSSPIPPLHPPAYANVHLETLVLPPSRPLMLRGSVVVQNVCFAKDVAVRFTLDGWVTTSEVGGKYVCGLPGLPAPFPSAGATEGDLAARPAGSAHGRSQSESAASMRRKESSPPPLTWDRFSFTIALEDFERKLAEKTLELVVRYTAHGVGEWWDNNSGQNYSVRFDKAEEKVKVATEGKDAVVSSAGQTKGDAVTGSPVRSNSQQRTFSAPPTLKGTPTTAEAVQHAVGKNSSSSSSSSNSASPANSSAETLPTLALPTSRRMHHNHHFAGPGHPHVHQHPHAHPTRPSPPPRTHSSPQPISQTNSYASYLNRHTNGYPGGRPHSMHASLPTKLNLLNYAAPSVMGHSVSAGPALGVPSFSSTSSSSSTGAGAGAKVSPPRSPLAQSPIIGAEMVFGAEMGMVGGMPASVPKFDFSTWMPPTKGGSDMTTPTNSTSSTSSSFSLPPSPPPSYSAMPPPASLARTASPTSMSEGSATSSSSSSPSSSDSEKTSRQPKTHHHSHQHQHRQAHTHAPRVTSPVPVGVDANSSYAALLKQWCFAQSPSPGASPVGTPVGTPGVGAPPASGLGLEGSVNANVNANANWRVMGFESMNGHGMRSESPMMLAGL